MPEEPCTSHLPPTEDSASREVSPSSSTSSVGEENDSLRQPEAQAEASTSDNKDKAKTKRNRCFMCRKKVGLTGKISWMLFFLMDSAEGNRKQFRWFLKKKLLINFFQLSLIFHSNCKKFICGKEARVQTP